MTGNVAATGGGIGRTGVASYTMRNSILAGNVLPGKHDALTASRVITSQNYNVLGAVNGCSMANAGNEPIGSAVTPVDPKLDPRANNGGPTQTMALLGGSPAIDGGNPTASQCESKDQRGVPRSLSGRCSIGAYEPTTCQGKVVNRVGTDGANTITGTSSADGILGLGGPDTLSGLGSNDGICGGDGPDTLSGGEGDDSFDGGRALTPVTGTAATTPRSTARS